MKTVELEALQIGLQQSITGEFLNAGVEFVQDVLTDRIKIAIRGFVWAEKESVRQQDIKYPRDWWQAFKERWFPAWLLRKYPVDYHHITIDVRAIYPDFKQAMPEYTSRLMIQRSDGFSSDYWREAKL